MLSKGLAQEDPSDRCDSSFRVRLHYAALKGHIARVPELFLSGRLNSSKNAIIQNYSSQIIVVKSSGAVSGPADVLHRSVKYDLVFID